MNVTPPVLRAIREELGGDFDMAYEQANEESMWMEIAMETQSMSSANLYAWLSDMPWLREWIGDRVIRDVAEHAFRVPNRDFESTIAVRRPDIMDDQLAQYSQAARLMGLSARRHVDHNAFQTLKGGLSAKGPDGKNFFADDHKIAANVDGTGAKTSASNILNSAVTAGEQWYLIWSMMGFGPVIYQNRMDPEFDDIEDSTQHTVFMSNKFVLGIWARRAFSYAFWQWGLTSRDTLNVANFEAGYEQMCAFQRDGKIPWGLKPTALIVPTALGSEGRDIVLTERLDNGKSNHNLNRVKIIESVWL